MRIRGISCPYCYGFDTVIIRELSVGEYECLCIMCGKRFVK